MDQLNGRYDTDRSWSFNQAAGNVPGRPLLEAARRVELVVAVATVVLLYLVAESCAGVVAGAVAVALGLVNPLLPTLWTRALAEAPLACCSLLALWLVIRRIRLAARSPALGAWLTAGGALGLAAATKLSGGIGGLGLALFALIQQGTRWRTARRRTQASGWLLLGLGALVVFCAVNPLLYPDPVGRTLLLVQHRQEEMQQQRVGTPRLAVPDALPARVALVARRVFSDYAAIRLPGRPIWDALLVGIGLLDVARQLWRGHVAGRQRWDLVLLLCWVGAAYAVTVPQLGFDSSHYYAPLVLSNILVEAVGVAVGSRLVLSRVRTIHRSRHHQATVRARREQRGTIRASASGTTVKSVSGE